MRNKVRMLMLAPLALVLGACIDATVPRLPPGDEEPDTTKGDRTGYLGEVQPPVELG